MISKAQEAPQNQSDIASILFDAFSPPIMQSSPSVQTSYSKNHGQPHAHFSSCLEVQTYLIAEH